MTWRTPAHPVTVSGVPGVPLFEKSLTKRRGGYVDYIARASGLIPRPPRRLHD